MVATRNNSRTNDFRSFFFMGFQKSASSVASIKLINNSEDPRKFYKISVSTGNRVAIFENVRTRGFLLGRTRHEERVKNSTVVDLGDRMGNGMIGFWTL